MPVTLKQLNLSHFPLARAERIREAITAHLKEFKMSLPDPKDPIDPVPEPQPAIPPSDFVEDPEDNDEDDEGLDDDEDPDDD